MLNNRERAGTVRTASSDNKSSERNRSHNLIPKILCLFAAFVLWLYVMQVESPEYEDVISSVPVQLENVSELQDNEGLTVYSGTGHNVNIRVSGKKSIISKIKADDIKAYIDLSVIDGAGRHSLDVFVDLPEGISLVEPEPGTVTVYVDEIDTISLSVSERLLNFVLESPYELGEIDFEFDTVTVTGPKNRLATITSAQVAVNMADRKSTFVTTGTIALYDKNGIAVDMSYLNLSKREMTVSVPIYQTKEVPVEVGFKHGLIDPALVTITTVPETITVRGDASKFVDGISVVDKILIDEKLITSTPYTVTLQANTLTDVTIAPEDSEIKVTVEFDSSLKTKQFKVSDIKVKNADSDLEYEILDENILVTLRGKISELNSVKDTDITAEIDLSGFESGNSGTISKNATIIIDAEDAECVFEVGTYPIQIQIK